METFIDFMRENLTCAFDRPKCIEYLNSISTAFTYTDTLYALGMLDRWIAVGMFKGRLTFHHHQLDDLMQPEQDTMMTNNNTNKRQLACVDEVAKKRQR